jgi:hypothetical protein
MAGIDMGPLKIVSTAEELGRSTSAVSLVGALAH